MKKFIISLFFVIFALFNVCGEDLLHPVIRDDIDEDIKKIEQALVDYVLYPELVERGFDVHRLDNMKIDGEMFEYVESFFRPNDEKGWNALDNHHSFSLRDENGKEFRSKDYKRAVIFSNEYGTKDELLKKGCVENETMFYYPSNGEKDWRVGKWSWSFINYRGELFYRGPGRFKGTYASGMGLFDGGNYIYGDGKNNCWFGMLETKKSVVIDFDSVEDYINDVKLPKKDNLIIDLSVGNGGSGRASSKFVETIKNSKYKKIIIITGDTTSASENIVHLLQDDKRVIRIGRNTNGRHYVGGVKCVLSIKEKGLYLLYGDAIVSGVGNQEGIGYLPDIWADNKEDIFKNVVSITGDTELKIGTHFFIR
ncbi:S41 family peptidase [Treponema bryantii]|uniref:S41 family peptidase n=1 Tax=Treponema bryantii TaxID=163 RepID=UPI0003B41FBA|nr:S41 family peptidase [Treponema bryantii]